jgi:hypothetical protein
MSALVRLAVVPVLAALLAAGSSIANASTTHHLHEDDSGRTIHVALGDVIKVRLPGGSAGGYHRPRTSDRDVVRRTSASGGYPDDEDARASFIARRKGNVDLTSYDDYRCLHTDPRCLPPQRQWVVHVVVDRDRHR